jgi:hypothetical protein
VDTFFIAILEIIFRILPLDYYVLATINSHINMMYVTIDDYVPQVTLVSGLAQLFLVEHLFADLEQIM